MMIPWEQVALPVLQALAAPQDNDVRNGFLSLGHGAGAASLGLDLDDGVLHDALLALQDVGYVSIDQIQYEGSGGGIVLGARVTGDGMRALGEWPSLQAALSPATVAALLTRLQEYAPDKETREQLGTAADAVAKKGTAAVREAVVAFSAEALKAKLGLR